MTICNSLQEEDFQNMMPAERRKNKLEEKIQDLTGDLKREVKAREGNIAFFRLLLFFVDSQIYLIK